MPTFDPIEVSSQFTSDRVWEAYTSKYTTAGNYAVWAQGLLETNLKNLRDKLEQDDITPALVDLLALVNGFTGYTPGTVQGYEAPTAPVYETVPEYVNPDAPTYQTIPTYTAPTLGTISEVPAYTKPTAPDYETIPEYVAPTVGTLTTVPTYVAPTSPTYMTLPGYTAPQLAAMLDIPALTPLSIPDAPSTAISFTNAAFTDELLTSLKSKLSTDLGSGSTGLGSAEAALFARETARQNAVRAASYTEIATQFSSRGFDMPPGALLAKQTEMNNESAIRLSDSSSQIMAESARLAVDYNKHVLSVCVQLEDMLGRLHDSKIARDFDAAKTAVTLNIEGFKAIIEAEIAKGNLQKVVIDATVATNEGNIKVFMGKLEGQIEPIKAVVSVNQGLVQQYTSEITAAMAPLDAIVKNNDAIIKKYLGEIEATTSPIKALADVNKTYAQVYLADLEAATKPFMAAIQRNDGVVKQYIAEVEAEIAPIKALTDINQSMATGYNAAVQAAIAPLKSVSDLNQSMATAYSAAVQSASADVTASALPEELKIKQAGIEIDKVKAKTAIVSEAARMAIEAAFRDTTVSVETLKALSLQFSQMIASSWNTVSASASFGYSAGASTSYNGNVDDLSANVRYETDAKVAIAQMG